MYSLSTASLCRGAHGLGTQWDRPIPGHIREQSQEAPGGFPVKSVLPPSSNDAPLAKEKHSFIGEEERESLLWFRAYASPHAIAHGQDNDDDVAEEYPGAKEKKDETPDGDIRLPHRTYVCVTLPSPVSLSRFTLQEK